MERTRGAGVSLFPLFIGKAPGKQSQLSRPELIQEFFFLFFFFFTIRSDRKHSVVLHFHLSSYAAQ